MHLSPRLPLLLCFLLGLAARAEDERARKVREELEKQLTQLVGETPTRVRLEFEALDEPGYALKDAAFELDGAPLPAPALSTLAREGPHPVWSGEVRPGAHTVRARVTYLNEASIVVSDEGGYAWKLSAEVAFPVQKGLEVQVRVVPRRDGSQREIGKRMRLTLPATPVMVARLDDGAMPEPARPPPAVAAAPGEPAGLEEADLSPLPGERLPSRTGTAAPPRRRRSPATPAVAGGEPAAPPAAPLPEPEPEPEPRAAPPAEAPGAQVAAGDPGLLPATRPPPDAPTEPTDAGGEVPWAVLGGAGVVLALAVAWALWARRRALPPTFRDP